MTHLGAAARAGLSTVAGAAVAAVASALTEGFTWPLVSGLAACLLGVTALEYWNRASAPAPAPQLPRRTVYNQVATGGSRIQDSGGSATAGAEVDVSVTDGSTLKVSPTSASGDAEARRIVDDHSTVVNSEINADSDAP